MSAMQSVAIATSPAIATDTTAVPLPQLLPQRLPFAATTLLLTRVCSPLAVVRSSRPPPRVLFRRPRQFRGCPHHEALDGLHPRQGECQSAFYSPPHPHLTSSSRLHLTSTSPPPHPLTPSTISPPPQGCDRRVPRLSGRRSRLRHMRAGDRLLKLLATGAGADGSLPAAHPRRHLRVYFLRG